jgi:hypothetical protein
VAVVEDELVERHPVAHEPRGDGLVERLRERDRGLVAVGPGERDAPRVNLGRMEERLDHPEPLHHVDGLPRERVAARLVAGEGVLVEEEDAEALARHHGGGGAPAGAGPDDDGVVHAESGGERGRRIATSGEARHPGARFLTGPP